MAHFKKKIKKKEKYGFKKGGAVKMTYKPPFKLALRMFGYGKGNFIVVDSKGREYPHGGTLKTERRARNYLKKVQKKFK